MKEYVVDFRLPFDPLFVHHGTNCCARNAKEAVAAVMADENNSYSKNELKAAALNLKRLFGG